MNDAAITFDFHNTLAECPEWFELEVRHLPSAYLAWHAERPGMPFGTALTAEVLGRDSPEAQTFVAWFKRLFGE